MPRPPSTTSGWGTSESRTGSQDAESLRIAPIDRLSRSHRPTLLNRKPRGWCNEQSTSRNHSNRAEFHRLSGSHPTHTLELRTPRGVAQGNPCPEAERGSAATLLATHTHARGLPHHLTCRSPERGLEVAESLGNARNRRLERVTPTHTQEADRDRHIYADPRPRAGVFMRGLVF